jgi:hypothetical protein
MSGAISLIALIESEFEAELESESPHMLNQDEYAIALPFRACLVSEGWSSH